MISYFLIHNCWIPFCNAFCISIGTIFGTSIASYFCKRLIKRFITEIKGLTDYEIEVLNLCKLNKDIIFEISFATEGKLKVYKTGDDSKTDILNGIEHGEGGYKLLYALDKLVMLNYLKKDSSLHAKFRYIWINKD